MLKEASEVGVEGQSSKNRDTDTISNLVTSAVIFYFATYTKLFLRPNWSYKTTESTTAKYAAEEGQQTW